MRVSFIYVVLIFYVISAVAEHKKHNKNPTDDLILTPFDEDFDDVILINEEDLIMKNGQLFWRTNNDKHKDKDKEKATNDKHRPKVNDPTPHSNNNKTLPNSKNRYFMGNVKCKFGFVKIRGRCIETFN